MKRSTLEFSQLGPLHRYRHIVWCALLLVVSTSFAEDTETTIARAAQLASSGDFEAAKALYMPLAKQGDPVAQYQLGEMYRVGYLSPELWSGPARNWLKKSAVQGYAPARASYGLLLARSSGRKVQKWARGYLTSAADQGNPNAQYYAALFFLKELYKPEVQTGKDVDKALVYLEMAAENDVLDAQRLLSSIYLRGRYTATNSVEGAKWALVLANRGVVEAQRILGDLYAEGIGVEQDWSKARQWYEEAASQGDKESLSGLARIFDSGLGVEPDEAQAGELNQRAALVPSPPELLEVPSRRFPSRSSVDGFVILDFTVTDTGEVADIEVEYSDPPVVYDSFSKDAAARFKYRPGEANGRSVQTEHVRYCMTWIQRNKEGARMTNPGLGTTGLETYSASARNKAFDLNELGGSSIGMCFGPDPASAMPGMPD